MYPIQNGLSFLVQQSVTGTGVFNGSEYGRAQGRFPFAALPNSDNVVRISARLYGLEGNNYQLQLVDPGIGTNNPSTTAVIQGSRVVVTLRRSSGGGLLATAQEVADAINRARLGVGAWYEGTGNGVVAAQGATVINNVRSGVNSTQRGPNVEQYIWSLPINTNGGFFYFEQEQPVLVHQFESKFDILSGGPHTVTVARVNLTPNLDPIAGESIPVFVWNQLTPTRPDISFSDVGILLHPLQALTVSTSTALTGVVRFDVRKSAGYPFP